MNPPKKVIPDSWYARERAASRIKQLRRQAAERERKLLETTSLGKLIK